MHERYMVEVVEAHDVCPFSRRARETGELQRDVILDEEPTVEGTLAVLDRVLAAHASARPEVSVVIVIWPRVTLAFEAWDRFAQSVRAVDQARHGGSPAFAAAAFHPDYTVDERTPQTLVPFFRRSPDPSLQFVRLRVLDEVRGGKRGKFHFDAVNGSWAELEKRLAQVSVTERITDDNHRMASRVGTSVLAQRLAEIRADRDASYARAASAETA